MVNYLSFAILFAFAGEAFSFLADTPSVIISGGNPIQKPAGEQLSLLCRVEGAAAYAKPGIHWQKNGGLDKSKHVEMRRLDGNTLSLVINNATWENSGVYTCNVQLGSLKLQATVDVVIFAEMKFADRTTRIGSVMATASVNLSCEVVTPMGGEALTTWTHHGAPIVQDGKHRLYKNNAVLEIVNYNALSNAGEYVCKVYHPRSGNTLTRTISVGSANEEKLQYCTKTCSNMCGKLFPLH